eukprot:COSAG06_NODE_759_length_12508_cov_9.809171_11_plen_378_part_00
MLQEETWLELQEETWLELQAILKNLSTIRHCRTIDADDGRWIEADDFGIALEMCQIDEDAAPVRRLTQRCSSADRRVDFQQFLVLSRGPEPEPEPAHPLSKLGKLGKFGGKQKDKLQRRDVEVSIEGGIIWSSGSVLRDIVSATWSGSQQLSPAQIVSVSHRADIDVNVFQVVSRVKAGKVYKFKAESEPDCKAWMQGIQDCIDANRAATHRAKDDEEESAVLWMCDAAGETLEAVEHVAHFVPIVGAALVLIRRSFTAVQIQSARDDRLVDLQAQLQLLARQIGDVLQRSSPEDMQKLKPFWDQLGQAVGRVLSFAEEVDQRSWPKSLTKSMGRDDDRKLKRMEHNLTACSGMLFQQFNMLHLESLAGGLYSGSSV